MYWDLKVLVPPLKIMKEKLLLYHHISTLSPSTLCNKVLKIQQKFKFPSIENEPNHFLNKHEIIDVRSYSKSEWNDLICRKIDTENREFIINWSRKYKKIDTLSLECEEYEMKNYFFIT